MFDEKQVSFAVLGVVALTAVISTVFLLSSGAETGQAVKPFDKVYVNPDRVITRGQVPSQMTSCGQGKAATQDLQAANDPACEWDGVLRVHCCEIERFA